MYSQMMAIYIKGSWGGCGAVLGYRGSRFGNVDACALAKLVSSALRLNQLFIYFPCRRRMN